MLPTDVVSGIYFEFSCPQHITDGASIAHPHDVQCFRLSSSRLVTLSDGRSITLLEALGRGTLGTVYRGLLESSWGVKRPVAVKLIALRADVDLAEAMRQLGRMARRAVCVRHRSVVQLFEVDKIDGPAGEPLSPCTVMELVEGESLASIMETWRADGVRVPIDFAMVVTLHTAEALSAALFTDDADGSLTGLVHGDVSPRQILISSEGETKLGDFGQFAFTDASSHIRSRSRLAYTAPEVASGATPNTRADVFSLGAILHELLVGPRFAPGTSIADAARMVQDGAFHSTILEPNLPRGLRDIVNRATDPDPMARYPHARAMAFDLRREMLRLGLCDAQTCVRHAIVGRCDARESAPPQKSGIVSTLSSGSIAFVRRGPHGSSGTK